MRWYVNAYKRYPPSPKLSRLEIDVDKDWLSKKIYNMVLDMLATTPRNSKLGGTRREYTVV